MNKESRTTAEITTAIIEAYHTNPDPGRYVRLTEIAATAGLNAEEIGRGVLELLETCDDFSADPEPLGHRITAADEAMAPVIGGEARHAIRFI